MKIEWLDLDMTEAIVIRGWFRKMQAHVRRISREEWHSQEGANWWRFKETNRAFPFSSSLECERDAETRRRAESQEWRPVEPMAVARVVRR